MVGALARAGTEGQIVEFVRAAHPDHARCTIICLSDAGPLAPEARSTGARVISLELRRSGSNPAVRVWRLICGCARLAVVLRQLRPDVIYAFLGLSYLVAFPIAALASSRATRVAALRAIAGTEGNSLVEGRAQRVALRLAHGAISNSESVLPSWYRVQPRLRTRTFVVVNGVPERPARRHCDRTPVRIICVASLKKLKDHSTLLIATSLLEPECDWELCLVGGGPEEIRLRQEAADLGIAARVRFLGERDDVATLIGEADIAALTSRSEGTPNSVIEAMSHGLPVVATAVGEIPSALEDGGGELVGPGDATALRSALARLIRNPALRARKGSEAHRIARARYGVPKMRDQTLKAFEAIESGRRRRA